MTNDDGFRLLIVGDPERNHSVNANIPNTIIWMNVRDYDGTIAILKEHGYTAFENELDLESLKTTPMKAPDGHLLVVVYHKRKNGSE